ncbi:unnamed protein product [Rhizophagus irregularis]|nr:unnamed protein product [Rhizophagus irregularis]
MRRSKTSRPHATIPKLRVKAKKSLSYEESSIDDMENNIPFKDIPDDNIEDSVISPDNVDTNMSENELAYEKLTNEESDSTDKNSTEKINEESDYMDIDDNYIIEEVSIEDIDDPYRPLLDATEEEIPVDSDVLEEESPDFKGFDEPETYDFYVDEIMYHFDGRWKYRNIAERHRLPCEFIKFKQPQQNLPILKIFLDIYIDDFGFVPFGASLNDFITPILQDIRLLENGLVMETLNGRVWVVGGVGCTTADLPQGNDLAGVKRHGANHGCRTCNVPNDQYTNSNYNFIKNARFNQQTDKRLTEIRNQNSRGNKEYLATKYGLVEPAGPFNNLQWDRHLQTPQDAYHSMAGKARTLLEATFNILNANGENAFIEYWRSIEKPAHWSRMPNPLRHRQSFMFSDVLKLVMLMPFILRRFLKPHHIKVDTLNNWRENLKIRQNSMVVSKLVTCWAIEAKTLKLAFLTIMTESIYQELQNSLKEEREILIQLFPNNFTNLPNLHVNVHLLQHARNFATLVNTAVGVKEMVHRTFKERVPHTNRKVIELDLTRQYNTIQALRHLIDGCKDHRFNERTNTLKNLSKDPKLHTILSGWYATENSSIMDADQNENSEDTVCHNENFIDLKLGNQRNIKKIKSIPGLTKKLDTNNPFFQDLYKVYRDQLGSKAALLNKNLEFYGSIAYTVLRNPPIRIKLCVGDVVEIEEESEGIAYARIKLIIRHKANNGHYYAFFAFEWFEVTNITDPILGCPLYKIQEPEQMRWFQIFTIDFVNHVPCVHFIHNCTNTCNSEHDEANRNYILNRFYYNPV